MAKYGFLETSFKEIFPLKIALYVVATPIGNLSDITFRALQVLSLVDKILCEDTRVALKLLNFFQIKKPLISYHQNNEKKVTPKIISEILDKKKSFALISDAGTPCISDPGTFIISELIKYQIPIIPIPGPSSLIALLSVSGFYLNDFFFIGFLPIKKSKRLKKLVQCLSYHTVIVIYESPYRIIKLLDEIASIFNPNCLLVVGRELTKKFETVYYGSIEQSILIKDQFYQKGEYTLLIYNRQVKKNTF